MFNQFFEMSKQSKTFCIIILHNMTITKIINLLYQYMVSLLIYIIFNTFYILFTIFINELSMNL